MTLARDDLTKSDAMLGAAIESNVPELISARALTDALKKIIRSKGVAKLHVWIEAATMSLVDSFTAGVEKDIKRSSRRDYFAMVERTDQRPITKLQLIKRQMNGGTKNDLLQARMIGATLSNLQQMCVRPFCAKHGVPDSTVIDTKMLPVVR